MPDTKTRGDHSDYFGMARRVIRAAGRRAGGSDPEDLVELAQLRRLVDQALAEAVKAQREAGFSWAEIAAPLDITRQSAQEKWGR